MEERPCGALGRKCTKLYIGSEERKWTAGLCQVPGTRCHSEMSPEGGGGCGAPRPVHCGHQPLRNPCTSRSFRVRKHRLPGSCRISTSRQVPACTLNRQLWCLQENTPSPSLHDRNRAPVPCSRVLRDLWHGPHFPVVKLLRTPISAK